MTASGSGAERVATRSAAGRDRHLGGQEPPVALGARHPQADLVAHLERHGYVERVPDPADGRARLVRATNQGRPVFAIARELVTEVDAELDARMGPERVALLRELAAAVEAGRESGADA